MLLGTPGAHASEFCHEIERFLPEESGATGQLRVEVNPGWGKVFVDGAFLSVTPMDAKDIEAGDHCVEIVHPDGKPRSSRPVKIAEGQLTVLRVNLARKDKGPNCTPFPEPESTRLRVRPRSNIRKDKTWYVETEPMSARSLCEEGSKRGAPPTSLDAQQEALLCARRSGFDVLIAGNVPAFVVDVWVDGELVEDADGAFYASSDTKRSRIVFDLNEGMWTVKLDTAPIHESIGCVKLLRKPISNPDAPPSHATAD